MGFGPGGSSPLAGSLGQPYPQGGPFNDPLAGPPRGGVGPLGRGGSAPGGGGSWDPNPGARFQMGALPPLGSGSLKGTVPTIFDGN
jgi:hypothetical protein